MIGGQNAYVPIMVRGAHTGPIVLIVSLAICASYSENTGHITAMKRVKTHFSDDWVRSKILKPYAFEGINAEAQIIAYTLIETGCRPSEIANLMPENICLDEDVPHIRIRPTADRELKSVASRRDIPLVGVACPCSLSLQCHGQMI